MTTESSSGRALPSADAVAGGERWRWGRVAGVLAGLAVVTRLPGLVFAPAFNPDEATLATGARSLLDGGSLYVDVIDRKPPLPFAAYEVVFGVTGSHDLRWMRLLGLVLVVLTALVLADEARRRWGTRAGWTAGVVTVVAAAALGPRDAPPANFELFALLPIAVAVVAAARSRPALAGVALAVAVLCKQPAAITIVPVAWSWWKTRGWVGMAVGAVAGAVAGLALAVWFDVGKVLEWALLGTGGYLGLRAADLPFAAGRLAAIVAIALGFWAGAWLLVHAAARPGAVGPHGRSRRDDLDLWLLLAVSAVAVVPGLRFFPHYLLQLVPAVALLAGRGLAARPARLRPAAALGVAATLVAVALAWGTGATDPGVERRLAAYARDHTTPVDQILVWGNLPEVYWRAQRVPAGGFTHSEFITGASGGRAHREKSEATVPEPDVYRDWLARLAARPPALVFDTTSAGIRGGRDFPLANFTALARFVADHYRLAATVDGVRIYRLTDPSPPPR